MKNEKNESPVDEQVYKLFTNTCKRRQSTILMNIDQTHNNS